MSSPRIGMTSFIDYFVATSPTKVSKVRAAKRMMDGDGFDHWQPFRKAATDSLIVGGDKRKIDECISAASPRRATTFNDCGRELKKWMGRKTFSATALGRGKVWTRGTLAVSVNPELRVSINGQPPVILKFYFKAERLSKRSADPMLRLIEQTHGTRYRAAILDVQRGRLHIGPAPSPDDLDLLLDAEARGFATIWAGL